MNDIKIDMFIRNREDNNIRPKQFKCSIEELQEFSNSLFNKSQSFQSKTGIKIYPNFKILLGKKEMNIVCIAHTIKEDDDEHVRIYKGLINSLFHQIVYVPVDTMLDIVDNDPIQAYACYD